MNYLLKGDLDYHRSLVDSFGPAFRKVSDDGDLNKSFVQMAMPAADAIPGLQVYNLEPLKDLTILETPLLNVIPRQSGAQGTATEWKAINGINTGKSPSGVEEGKRAGSVDWSYETHIVGFKGIGQEDDATFEAGYAHSGVLDVRSQIRYNAWYSLRQDEELLIFGGNNSVELGTPAAPAGVAAATAGSEVSTMTARTIKGRIVALTMEGNWFASLASGLATVIARNNNDGTTTNINGGSSNKSAASGDVVVSAGQKVTWTWTSVQGATHYAIYTGVAGSEKLAMIVGCVNKWVQFADEDAGAQAATAITEDRSKNALVWDGILSQLLKAGSGAYVSSVKDYLVANNAGNIPVIDAAIASLWDLPRRFRISHIVVNINQALDITKAIFSLGSGQSVLTQEIRNPAGFTAGIIVTHYRDPISGTPIPIVVHPLCPDGMVLGLSLRMSRPLKGVPAPWRMLLRQEYYSIDWPLQTRKYVTGVYMDGVLQGYTPAANFVLMDVYRAP